MQPLTLDSSGDLFGCEDEIIQEYLTDGTTQSFSLAASLPEDITGPALVTPDGTIYGTATAAVFEFVQASALIATSTVITNTTTGVDDNQPTTLVAQVTPAGVTGTVTFTATSSSLYTTVLGTVAVDADGIATLQTTITASESIAASYGGDRTPRRQRFRRRRVHSSPAADRCPEISLVDQFPDAGSVSPSVTFVAKVSSYFSADGSTPVAVPTGTVTFYVNRSEFNVSPLDDTGRSAVGNQPAARGH